MTVECFPERETIKVFLKMSHEDFVYDYRFIINDDQGFDSSGKIDTTEVWIRKYLISRIQIFADNKKLQGKITGFESANGELKMNLLYSFNKKVKHLKVQNTILTGSNKNQSVLLIFRYNDFEDGIKLTEEKPEYIFRVN